MNPIHIHLHFHAAPDGDVPTPLFNELKRMITMNFDEVSAALEESNTKLEAANAKLAETNARFDKGINEVILAIQNSGGVPQNVADLVTRLKANVEAVSKTGDDAAGRAGTLDDLNPDSTPVP